MTDWRLIASEHQRVAEAYAKRNTDDPRYSWLHPGHLFMIQGRERAMLNLFRREGIQPAQVDRLLDLGCGQGYWMREWIKWGLPRERAVGMDLLTNRVREARAAGPRASLLLAGSGATLPFAAGAFDVVYQSTVFTSVLDPMIRSEIAHEMIRVLRPGGHVIWYDYFADNPRNSDVRGVRKKEIHQLFPDCTILLRRVTLAPPIARAIAPHSWWLATALEAVPLLRTHYLGIITPR